MRVKLSRSTSATLLSEEGDVLPRFGHFEQRILFLAQVMSNLVETAKQGDPAAIAQLINRSLQPKGITAKVALRDDCLKIILEASPAPSGELSDYIYKGISNLDIPTIQGLTVYGRNSGDEFPAWTREFSLNAFDEPAAQTEQSVDQDVVCCPRCRSSQVGVGKKGFGIGKAIMGALLLGPIGLAAGMIDSNEVMLSCLKCGHRWQSEEEEKPTPVIQMQDAALSNSLERVREKFYESDGSIQEVQEYCERVKTLDDVKQLERDISACGRKNIRFLYGSPGMYLVSVSVEGDTKGFLFLTKEEHDLGGFTDEEKAIFDMFVVLEG